MCCFSVTPFIICIYYVISQIRFLSDSLNNVSKKPCNLNHSVLSVNVNLAVYLFNVMLRRQSTF